MVVDRFRHWRGGPGRVGGVVWCLYRGAQSLPLRNATGTLRRLVNLRKEPMTDYAKLPYGRLFNYTTLKSFHAAKLAEEGYTIVKLMTTDEAKKFEDMIWQDLEGLGTGIKRGDPSTWNNKNWPQTTHGLIQNQQAGKWEGVCTARMETVPFWTSFFGGEQPLLSFDAISVARPSYQKYAYKKGITPEVPGVSGWLHMDQSKNNPACAYNYQGALAITDLGQAELKTQLIIPKEGETIQSFRERFLAAFPPTAEDEGRDWVPHTVAEKRWLAENGRVISPNVPAGSMLIWDSGVSHASVSGTLPDGQDERRIRISCFVSAIPKCIVGQDELKVRQQLLRTHKTSTHGVTKRGKRGTFLPNSFQNSGRTYGAALPNYSNKRVIEHTDDPNQDTIPSKMAKFCGGF
jgi:hypothetical protein